MKINQLTNIIYFAVISLVSCTSYYKVVLNDNNSAIVESVLPYGDKEVKKFTQSKLITILDTTDEYKLKFRISVIDSLGNYLQGLPFKIINFKTRADTLFILTDNTLDSINTNFHWSHLNLEIKSDREINIVQSDKKYVTIVDTNSIKILMTIRQLKKQEKGKIIVKLTN